MWAVDGTPDTSKWQRQANSEQRRRRCPRHIDSLATRNFLPWRLMWMLACLFSQSKDISKPGRSCKKLSQKSWEKGQSLPGHEGSSIGCLFIPYHRVPTADELFSALGLLNMRDSIKSSISDVIRTRYLAAEKDPTKAAITVFSYLPALIFKGFLLSHVQECLFDNNPACLFREPKKSTLSCGDFISCQSGINLRLYNTLTYVRIVQT
jgi:hypothetical protein